MVDVDDMDDGSMKAIEPHTMTLDEYKDKFYGKVGTKKRDMLEAGYEQFKIRTLFRNPHIEKSR